MRGLLTAIAAAWAASVAALLDVFYEFLDCTPAKLVRLAELLARGRSHLTVVDRYVVVLLTRALSLVSIT